jgi:NADH-quinone oxidoreductase subunit N
MDLTLNLTDMAAISPLLILLGGALILLLFESFAPATLKKCSLYFTVGTLLVALYASVYAPVSESHLLTPWLRFDSIARLFTVFFLLIGIGSALLSTSFFQRLDDERSHGEYFFLLLSSLFGLILIASAADFLTLFLGIETLSISLYVLCGFMKNWENSSEASIKYFLMGSLAAAFLLYGIALIYGAVGTTRLDALLTGYQKLTSTQDITLFLAGIAMVTLAFAFEAAIVPFQLWAPDVYAGAPTPVTAFMAVGTKVGAFAAFFRVFFDALPHFDPLWNEGIALLAYPTLIFSNYLALRQTRLRRFFAYSGISHAGFLLIPLAVGTSEALSAMLFYLVVYALATLGAFAVLAFVDRGQEGASVRDLQGLFKRSPLLAVILALCLLTLAGIPPTVGFFAKFFLFKIAFQAGYYALVIVALLTTILAAYYYLRIISVMFSDSHQELTDLTRSWPAAALGAITCAVIIVLSFYPMPLIELLAAFSR